MLQAISGPPPLPCPRTSCKFWNVELRAIAMQHQLLAVKAYILTDIQLGCNLETSFKIAADIYRYLWGKTKTGYMEDERREMEKPLGLSYRKSY